MAEDSTKAIDQAMLAFATMKGRGFIDIHTLLAQAQIPTEFAAAVEQFVQQDIQAANTEMLQTEVKAEQAVEAKITGDSEKDIVLTARTDSGTTIIIGHQQLEHKLEAAFEKLPPEIQATVSDELNKVAVQSMMVETSPAKSLPQEFETQVDVRTQGVPTR